MRPATPLPWHVGVRQAEQIIYDAKGWAVANATVYHGKADRAETVANARYIAHACNAYPELVSMIRRLTHPAADDWDVADAQTLLEKLGE